MYERIQPQPQITGESTRFVSSLALSGVGVECEQTVPEIQQRIIDVSGMALPQVGENQTSVCITSDTVIAVDGKDHELTPAQVGVLNALLESAGRELTGSELKDLAGFGRDHSQREHLSSVLKQLSRKFYASGDYNLVERQGVARGMTYHLNEGFELIDMRSDSTGKSVATRASKNTRSPLRQNLITTSNSLLRVIVSQPGASHTFDAESVGYQQLPENSYQEAVGLEDESSDAERDMIRKMVKEYKDHDEVYAAISRLQQGSDLPYSASGDGVKVYLEWASKYPLLEAADEVNHTVRMKKGLLAYSITEQNKAEDVLSTEELEELEKDVVEGVISHQTLVLSNLRLVSYIAKRYQGPKGSLMAEDILNVGVEGLHRAVEKFDFTRGYKFSTYATHWLGQRIGTVVSQESRTIRIPRNVHSQWREVTRADNDLGFELGREPSNAEIAEHLHMDVAKVEELRRVGTLSLPSLNMPIGDSDGELQDLLADSHVSEEEADDTHQYDEIMHWVECARLTDIEAYVLSLRQQFVMAHLVGHTIERNGMTLAYNDLILQVTSTDKGNERRKIGDLLGFSTTRIHQLESKALQKIRAQAEASVLRSA